MVSINEDPAMSLGTMDPALVCSGPMSNISYDSHVVTRRRMADELPRMKQDNQPDRFVQDCLGRDCNHLPHVQLHCSPDGAGGAKGLQGTL